MRTDRPNRFFNYVLKGRKFYNIGFTFGPTDLKNLWKYA